MTPPGPVFTDLFAFLDERYRLRVVDENKISREIHFRRIHPVDLEEVLKVIIGEIDLDAVEGVMHVLCDHKEPFIPLDDIPAGINAELFQQRNHARENFRDTAADRGGVDILERHPLKFFAKKEELVNLKLSGNGGVIFNVDHTAPPA